jgi:hypothetical protein
MTGYLEGEPASEHSENELLSFFFLKEKFSHRESYGMSSCDVILIAATWLTTAPIYISHREKLLYRRTCGYKLNAYLKSYHG